MSAPELIIRDARPADRPAIERLTLDAYQQYAEIMTPSAWRGLEDAVHSGLRTSEPVDRIVAEQGARIVGSVMLYAPEANAYGDGGSNAAAPELRLLAVDADARGSGIGQALVEECIRRARAMGATELGLHTSDSLVAAIRLYEGMGFVRAPEHDFQPEGAELVKGYRLVLR